MNQRRDKKLKKHEETSNIWTFNGHLFSVSSSRVVTNRKYRD